jgi:flagellar protein FliJ
MDKLQKVLQVRAKQEKASAQKLAARQRDREQAQQQQQQLDDLSAEYRTQHSQVQHTTAQHFVQFQRFYAQLNVAVRAQQEVVDKCVDAEHSEAQRYLDHHKERRALEELLQRRDQAHKKALNRRERRAQRPPQKGPVV